METCLFNNGTISLGVECWDCGSRGSYGVVRSRLRRHCMPCKEARKNDPCDESKTAPLEVTVTLKVRWVRAVADNKSPDTDTREAPYDLRRRRRRSD